MGCGAGVPVGEAVAVGDDVGVALAVAVAVRVAEAVADGVTVSAGVGEAAVTAATGAGMVAGWGAQAARPRLKRTSNILRSIARMIAYRPMSPDTPAPSWLWRAAAWGFALLLAGVAALAAALALGLADPPRAGPLLWEDDFKDDISRWTRRASEGARLEPRDGALVAEFTAAGQIVVALTDAPPGAFTLEVAGAQTEGETGARYGLVFGWRDDAHYAAVLVNGNGYAEAFWQEGATRTAAFRFQQWPHLLYGAASNRVRVDVEAGGVTARINDERLTGFEAPATGRLGVMAQSAGPGRVVFSWVRVWAPGGPERDPGKHPATSRAK